MKQLFKNLVLVLVLFSGFILLAQPVGGGEAPVGGTEGIPDAVDTSLPFLKMIGGFIMASLTTLFLNASKWWGSTSWSWKAFWKDVFMPFTLSIVGGIALIAIQVYLPQYKFLLHTAINGEISLNYVALFTTGGMLTLAIKKIIFRKKIVTQIIK